MDDMEDIKSFKLGPRRIFIFQNMPNITEIFMDHVEDIKSFKLGPSANISNLAFGIELMLKLTDKKVLMDGTSSTV
jgi:hypothetical protein